MKITLDLPDELLIEAKKQAAEQRRSLRAIVEEGLRLVLRKPHKSAQEAGAVDHRHRGIAARTRFDQPRSDVRVVRQGVKLKDPLR
jgi:hypothetical protein